MKINLYQIYYKDEQASEIDGACIPYKNKPSVMCETEVFYNEYDKGFEKDAYTGFISWKFAQKTGNSPSYFLDLCKKTQEKKHFDFYGWSPVQFNNQYDQFFNVWEQGEHWHPGLKEISKIVLDEAGLASNEILTMRNRRNSVLWCNYFIANNECWNDLMLNWYIPVYDAALRLSKEYPKICKGDTPSDTYLTFIMERIIITYLCLTYKKHIIFY